MLNMIIHDQSHPKVIDFGKAFLISDPIIYNIIVGSIKQSKYTIIHKPLAFELGHIPGSGVSIATDVFIH